VAPAPIPIAASAVSNLHAGVTAAQAIEPPIVQGTPIIPQVPTPVPVVIAPQFELISGSSTEGVLSVVQQDLDRNGAEEITQISDMLSMELYKQTGFFFNRRMIGIIDSLGIRFGLAPGRRTLSVTYRQGRSLNTTDMC
jgi:hypothetical protein